MEIDVIVDVVCPWCFVGKRELEKAMEARPGVVKAVRWRPYQLNPNTPKEGVDRKVAYDKKFGKDSEHLKVMREHLLERGDALGIDFDFEGDCIIGNSLDSHRLIRWARSAGVEDDVIEKIMAAYFEKNAFIGSPSFLKEIALEAGMDGELVEELLESDRDIDLVREEIAGAQQMGVQGVPFFIFNGKHAVSGAQSADVLVQVIDKIQAEAS